MNIYADTLEYATWTVTLDVDPTSGTASALIDGTWTACEWVGDAVEVAGKWTRSFRLLVGGSDTEGGDVTVTATQSAPLVRVDVDGEQVIRASTDSLRVA